MPHVFPEKKKKQFRENPNNFANLTEKIQQKKKKTVQHHYLR